MMERALVIGATGFVGRHIVQALVHSDLEVDAMRRWNSDPARVAALGVRTVVGDLLDRERLVEILPGYNYVFMAAAPRPVRNKRRNSRRGRQAAAYLRESALGMRNLLGVCREVDVERVVVTSCATTIARSKTGAMSTAEDVYLPGSGVSEDVDSAHFVAAQHYVEAQYAAELECFRQAADGLDLTILCPGICVGDGAVFPARRLLAGVSEHGRLNLVDVDDVARAHVEAARKPSRHPFGGDRRSLGGDNTSIGELYKRLEPAGGGERHLGRYDVRVTEDLSEIRHLSLFAANTWIDSSRAEHELGFRPRSI
jgi:nucleoside-diphosphate-sugar epimerase